MKLQSTLVASLFACVQYISAQSNLVIFSQDGHRFYLLVDGVQQNSTPQSNIKINGLPHNACKVKVVFENNTLTTVDKTIYFSPDEDLEYVYNLKADKHNKMQLRPLTHNSIASSTNNATNQSVYVYGSTVNNNNISTASPTVTGTNTNTTGGTTTTTVTTTEVRETTTGGNTTVATSPTNGNVTMSTTTGTTGGNVNVNMSGTGMNDTDLSNGNANLTISMGVGATGAGVNVSVTGTDDAAGNVNMGMNTTITDPEMNNGNINMGVNTTVTDNAGYPNTWGNGNSTNTTTTTTNNNGTVTSTTVTTTSTTTTTTTGGSSTAYPNNGGYSNNTTYNNNTNNTNYGSSNTSYTYTTANGCYMPMGDSDFNRLRSSVEDKGFDDERLAITKQALNANCMTALQIKDLMTEMSFDKARIEFAKYAYPNCIDPQNYFQVNDAFQFGTSAADLDKVLSKNPRPANPAYSNGGAMMAKPGSAANNNCFSAMSGADYSRLQASVKSKSFGKDQVAIGKQAVQSNCLTAEQIKGIMKIMSFDDTRLEFAQLAYPTCYDKQNFYQVNDAFAFPSSVEKLNKALGL